MIKLFLALFGISCGYQLFTTWCTARFRRRQPGEPHSRLRFCQIKPVRAPQPDTLEHIESFWERTSHRLHDFYLCSSQAAPDAWLKARPHFTWLKVNSDQSRNGKAATLAKTQGYWSGDVFVISDADMVCSDSYLDAVLGEFRDPKVGVVTCLYRGHRSEGSLGALFEALCIQDFGSSVLVAEQTEGVAFAMGSTMAIRREVLADIGGFEALEPYLADDFQLGYRAVKNGWKVAIAPTVMETHLGNPSLMDAFSHQYRWMVTSRVSRPAGHFAFVVTQGLPWALFVTVLNPVLGSWLLTLWCLLRIGCGSLQSWHLSGPNGSPAWRQVLLPLKDLLYFGLWMSSLKGNRVRWGPQEIEVDSEGKILLK